jgi:hypothetical protein
MGNVAYDAICFLQKLVQVLQAEDMGLYRARVVCGQYLAEDRCQVHCLH